MSTLDLSDLVSHLETQPAHYVGASLTVPPTLTMAVQPHHLNTITSLGSGIWNSLPSEMVHSTATLVQVLSSSSLLPSDHKIYRLIPWYVPFVSSSSDGWIPRLTTILEDPSPNSSSSGGYGIVVMLWRQQDEDTVADPLVVVIPTVGGLLPWSRVLQTTLQTTASAAPSPSARHHTISASMMSSLPRTFEIIWSNGAQIQTYRGQFQSSPESVPPASISPVWTIEESRTHPRYPAFSKSPVWELSPRAWCSAERLLVAMFSVWDRGGPTKTCLQLRFYQGPSPSTDATNVADVVECFEAYNGEGMIHTFLQADLVRGESLYLVTSHAMTSGEAMEDLHFQVFVRVIDPTTAMGGWVPIWKRTSSGLAAVVKSIPIRSLTSWATISASGHHVVWLDEISLSPSPIGDSRITGTYGIDTFTSSRVNRNYDLRGAIARNPEVPASIREVATQTLLQTGGVQWKPTMIPFETRYPIALYAGVLRTLSIIRERSEIVDVVMSHDWTLTRDRVDVSQAFLTGLDLPSTSKVVLLPTTQTTADAKSRLRAAFDGRNSDRKIPTVFEIRTALRVTAESGGAAVGTPPAVRFRYIGDAAA